MPYTPPTVNYCATIDGTYTSLTGIQTVSISRGRQRFQDNFTQTNCTIELIPATTYALPLAVGQFIDVRNENTDTSPCYFNGRITDIQRNYAIPYNSGTAYAPQDRIIITATGPTGALGTSSLSNYLLGTTDCTDAIYQLALSVGIYATFQQYASVQCSTTLNVNGGTLDVVNALLRTSQYFIDDLDQLRTYIDGSVTANLYPAGQGNTSFTFSDSGTAGAYKFSDLQYLSSVQNTFNQVQVSPAGLATQSATSGSAPYNTLPYQTYNKTTSDALSLANYILAVQSVTTPVPFSVTTNTLLDSSVTALSVVNDRLNTFLFDTKPMNLGASVTVIFRGTTVTATIQGINTTFYDDYATVQLFLSPSLSSSFTLDSTVLGVLDTNRLGYP
jgi:hypothetical protein